MKRAMDIASQDASWLSIILLHLFKIKTMKVNFPKKKNYIEVLTTKVHIKARSGQVESNSNTTASDLTGSY